LPSAIKPFFKLAKLGYLRLALIPISGQGFFTADS